jgi:hypothetical protein
MGNCSEGVCGVMRYLDSDFDGQIPTFRTLQLTIEEERLTHWKFFRIARFTRRIFEPGDTPKKQASALKISLKKGE